LEDVDLQGTVVNKEYNATLLFYGPLSRVY
jgi:hypothetical protein